MRPDRNPLRRLARAFTTAAVLLCAAGRSPAALVQFTLPADADVVAESAAAAPVGIDALGRAFLTASQAGVRAGAGQVGNGLPDNGQFIDVSSGGTIQLLPYTGNNVVRRSGTSNAPFNIAVPAGKYQSLTIFATSGEAGGTFSLGLNYSDGMVNVPGFSVPDWFTDPPPAGVGYLIDGLDRTSIGGAGFEDFDDPAIFAFPVQSPTLDPARTLTSLTVTRTSTANDVLNFFAATGNAVPEPASAGLLLCASAILLRRRRPLPRIRVCRFSVGSNA